MQNSNVNLKTLAIDFGEKRTGLAISDVNGKIAAPLAVLPRKDDAKLIKSILETAQKQSVSRLLLGIPAMHGETKTERELRTLSFLKKLKTATAKTKLEVVTWDESYSTQIASNDSRNVKDIDSKAASVFLQEFLDSQHRKS